jgi:hypothetical protein
VYRGREDEASCETEMSGYLEASAKAKHCF